MSSKKISSQVSQNAKMIEALAVEASPAMADLPVLMQELVAVCTAPAPAPEAHAIVEAPVEAPAPEGWDKVEAGTDQVDPALAAMDEVEVQDKAKARGKSAKEGEPVSFFAVRETKNQFYLSAPNWIDTQNPDLAKVNKRDIIQVQYKSTPKGRKVALVTVGKPWADLRGIVNPKPKAQASS